MYSWKRSPINPKSAIALSPQSAIASHSPKVIFHDLIKIAKPFHYQTKKASSKTRVANNIPRLLPGESSVGQFGDLNKIRRTGDNLTPHHIPSDAYMKQIGISGYTRNKGIAILMEQPHPGRGGRRGNASY